jgi:hypothetical protein
MGMNKYLFESDYSADSLRWINKRAEHESSYNPEELEKLQNEIIADNDAALAYFFSTEFPYKLHRMQKIILDNRDAKYAFLFAQNIRNCDIKALQKVVVDSKKVKYICKFACFVKGCDRKPLESIILKSKNVKYAHMFLKHVKGSDVNKFKDVIMSSKKPRYLFELAKHTKDPKVLSQIEDIIIETQSFTYMRLLAEKIKAVNIEKIEQAVLDSDNVNEIKKFAKYVKRSKMKRFFLVL